MDEIIVRSAVMADLEVLLEFERGIIDAERAFDPLIRTDGDVRYYDIPWLIGSPDVELVVAEVDGDPIGCGYALIATSKAFLQHRSHSYLGFMFVVPEHRGKGVNKLIIQALESWSTARGLTVMQLEVYVGNGPAISAYERAGFQSNLLEMRKTLDMA